MITRTELTGIISLFLCYLPPRVWGVVAQNEVVSDFSLSVLACESALLFPRSVCCSYMILNKNANPW